MPCSGRRRRRWNSLQAQYDALKQQLDWFKRQLFGQKSEKRLDIDPAEQLNLLAGLGVKAPPSSDDVPTQTVNYERRAKVRDAAVAESGLRFGPEVPVQTIEVTDPAIEAIPEPEREVIGEKVSYRLAQQPGSYVVLKYIRKVVKRLDTKTILTPPAPANVLERSAADVSFLAGMLVDKFSWPPAAVPPASAPSRRRHRAQPLHPDLLDEPRHRPAGADHRGAERACAREPGAGDGRDLDQGRTRGEGQDAHRMAVAGVRRCRRGGVPLRVVARAPSRPCLSR